MLWERVRCACFVLFVLSVVNLALMGIRQFTTESTEDTKDWGRDRGGCVEFGLGAFLAWRLRVLAKKICAWGISQRRKGAEEARERVRCACFVFFVLSVVNLALMGIREFTIESTEDTKDWGKRSRRLR